MPNTPSSGTQASAGGGGGTTTAPTISICTNPYAADINPGDPDGRKLWTKAVLEGHPEAEKIKITQENAPEIMNLFKKWNSKFAYGSCTGNIPVSYEEVSNSIKLKSTGNILDGDANGLNLDLVRYSAHMVWGSAPDPTSLLDISDIKDNYRKYLDLSLVLKVNDSTDTKVLYARVRRDMLGRLILNVIDKTSEADLMTKMMSKHGMSKADLDAAWKEADQGN
jgi:hypothetical protein